MATSRTAEFDTRLKTLQGRSNSSALELHICNDYDIEDTEIDEPAPLDLIPFAQASKILHERLGATNAELAMWVFQKELRAWRMPTQKFNFTINEKPSTAGAAAQMMITLKIQLSASEVEAFNPCERYLDYETVLHRINNEATSNSTAIQIEWERIHKNIFSTNSINNQPMIASVIPGNGYAEQMKDGIFFESEIKNFLEPRSIKEASSLPLGESMAPSLQHSTIVEIQTDEKLAALFDLVPMASLERMFPANGKWKDWTERAARNGLKAAREKQAMFNPYRAALWFHNKGMTGWDLARCNRVLANNLPPRSKHQSHLLVDDLG